MKTAKTHFSNWRFVNMIKSPLFFFSLFFSFGFSVIAQNGIFVDNNVNCINTITRNTAIGDTIIHYVKTSDSTGHFLYNFSQGKPPLGHFKKIPITGYDITDFTIVNDTIYMCGIKTNKRGFYGWIKFGSATGTVQMNGLHLCDDTSFVTNPRRIRVFHNNHGNLVFLVADCSNRDYPSGIPVIAQIRNGSDLSVAYTSDEYFDDFEVLDDYVVSVARKGLNNPTKASLYMRTAEKPTFLINDFLFKYCHTAKVNPADSRVLLQQLKSNVFVAVYQNNSGYYIDRHYVDNFVHIQIDQHITVSASVDKIDDVSYNRADKSLMVLYNRNQNYMASRINFSSYPLVSADLLYYPAVSGYCSGCPALLMSLSRIGVSKFLVSGVLNNDFLLWNTNNSGCNISQSFTISPTSSSMGYFQNEPTFDSIGFESIEVTLPVQDITVPMICN